MKSSIFFQTVACLALAGLCPASPIPEAPKFLTAEQKAPLDVYAAALEANAEQYREYLATVDGKYIGALEGAREKMVKIGAARAAVALDSEIDRIRAGETERSPEIDAAPDYVRKMRDQYDQFIGRMTNVKLSRDGAARFAVVDGFGPLQVELTKAEELDKAMALRTFRKTLARPPAPPKKPEPEPQVGIPESEPEPRSEPEPEPELEERVDPPAGPRYGIDEEVPRAITAAEMERFADSIPPRPAGGSDGYPVMVASIKRGEVTEIKIDIIKGWGKARLQMWRGKPHWTATVSYPTTSLFGTFDTEGMAIIDGNRIAGWLYTGSGEEIP